MKTKKRLARIFAALSILVSGCYSTYVIGPRVSGQIVDVTTNASIRGAKMRVEYFLEKSGHVTFVVFSDEDGFFEIPVAEERRWRKPFGLEIFGASLTFSAKGYITSSIGVGGDGDEDSLKESSLVIKMKAQQAAARNLR